MPRAGDRDARKEEAWRGIFAAHRASKLTATDFCRKHGLQIAQFYKWRTKIEKRNLALAAEARRVAKEAQAQKKLQQQEFKTPEFAEVQIVEQSFVPPTQSDSLEIEFANGAKVRLTSGSSMVLLESVVRILERR